MTTIKNGYFLILFTIISLLFGGCAMIGPGSASRDRYATIADRISPYIHKISTIFMALMTIGILGLNIKEVVGLFGSSTIGAAIACALRVESVCAKAVAMRPMPKNRTTKRPYKTYRKEGRND